MFQAYFEGLADLGDLDAILTVGGASGLDTRALQEALADRRYREAVDDGYAWARRAGITGIPTFIFNEQYAIVGAQEYPAFQAMMAELQ